MTRKYKGYILKYTQSGVADRWHLYIGERRISSLGYRTLAAAKRRCNALIKLNGPVVS